MLYKAIALTTALLGMAGFASGQPGPSAVDVLGAHNIYGRGCVACHAPRSAATSGSGGKLALWGHGLAPKYEQTQAFGEAGKYLVTIPNYDEGLPSSASDGMLVIAACLSCHDGNIAKVAMTKGTAVETTTFNGLAFRPPTFLGYGGSPGRYDHPLGATAVVGCGGQNNWDCTVNAGGTLSFSGTASSTFLSNYFDVTKYGPISALVKIPVGAVAATPMASVTSGSWITCTTCHDQHEAQYFSAGRTYYRTRSFVRGWYDPSGTNGTGNSAAQFCRSCHGDKSNEMRGQMGIPTT